MKLTDLFAPVDRTPPARRENHESGGAHTPLANDPDTPNIGIDPDTARGAVGQFAADRVPVRKRHDDDELDGDDRFTRERWKHVVSWERASHMVTNTFELTCGCPQQILMADPLRTRAQVWVSQLAVEQVAFLTPKRGRTFPITGAANPVAVDYGAVELQCPALGLYQLPWAPLTLDGYTGDLWAVATTATARICIMALTGGPR